MSFLNLQNLFDEKEIGDVTNELAQAIQEVVAFARCIPGFDRVSESDQVCLLKAGSFEVSVTS